MNTSLGPPTAKVAMSGAEMMPAMGPMTAMSPIPFSSPKTWTQANQVINPKDRPLTNRSPTRMGNGGNTAEPRLAATARPSAAMKTRRRGLSQRPEAQDPVTKPLSWATPIRSCRDQADAVFVDNEVEQERRGPEHDRGEADSQQDPGSDGRAGEGDEANGDLHGVSTVSPLCEGGFDTGSFARRFRRPALRRRGGDWRQLVGCAGVCP